MVRRHPERGLVQVDVAAFARYLALVGRHHRPGKLVKRTREDGGAVERIKLTKESSGGRRGWHDVSRECSRVESEKSEPANLNDSVQRSMEPPRTPSFCACDICLEIVVIYTAVRTDTEHSRRRIAPTVQLRSLVLLTRTRATAYGPFRV